MHEAQEPCSLPYAPETFVQLDQRLSRLEEQCVDALRTQGFPRCGSRGWVGLATQRACSSPATPSWIYRLISQTVLGPLQWAVVKEGWTPACLGRQDRSPLGGPV